MAKFKFEGISKPSNKPQQRQSSSNRLAHKQQYEDDDDDYDEDCYNQEEDMSAADNSSPEQKRKQDRILSENRLRNQQSQSGKQHSKERNRSYSPKQRRSNVYDSHHHSKYSDESPSKGSTNSYASNQQQYQQQQRKTNHSNSLVEYVYGKKFEDGQHRYLVKWEQHGNYQPNESSSYELLSSLQSSHANLLRGFERKMSSLIFKFALLPSSNIDSRVTTAIPSSEIRNGQEQLQSKQFNQLDQQNKQQSSSVYMQQQQQQQQPQVVSSAPQPSRSIKIVRTTVSKPNIQRDQVEPSNEIVDVTDLDQARLKQAESRKNVNRQSNDQSEESTFQPRITIKKQPSSVAFENPTTEILKQPAITSSQTFPTCPSNIPDKTTSQSNDDDTLQLNRSLRVQLEQQQQLKQYQSLVQVNQQIQQNENNNQSNVNSIQQNSSQAEGNNRQTPVVSLLSSANKSMMQVNSQLPMISMKSAFPSKRKFESEEQVVPVNAKEVSLQKKDEIVGPLKEQQEGSDKMIQEEEDNNKSIFQPISTIPVNNQINQEIQMQIEPIQIQESLYLPEPKVFAAQPADKVFEEEPLKDQTIPEPIIVEEQVGMNPTQIIESNIIEVEEFNAASEQKQLPSTCQVNRQEGLEQQPQPIESIVILQETTQNINVLNQNENQRQQQKVDDDQLKIQEQRKEKRRMDKIDIEQQDYIECSSNQDLDFIAGGGGDISTGDELQLLKFDDKSSSITDSTSSSMALLLKYKPRIFDYCATGVIVVNANQEYGSFTNGDIPLRITNHVPYTLLTRVLGHSIPITSAFYFRVEFKQRQFGGIPLSTYVSYSELSEKYPRVLLEYYSSFAILLDPVVVIALDTGVKLSHNLKGTTASSTSEQSQKQITSKS